MSASAPVTAALEVLVGGCHLSVTQTHDAVAAIMSGEVADGLIMALLTAIRIRGESADELAGAVAAVRDHAVAWPSVGASRSEPILDTCGTGGDGACTVNISTATAIVVAASGVTVAKHGNRSASGNSGSAEVLAELGVVVEPPVDVLQRCLRELRLTFLFAPKFHPSLRFAAPARRQLPFRTLFNLVGPLANPARPTHQLIGVPDPRLADLMAEALVRLGIHRAAVVTGGDGLDEVSLGGDTEVRWVEDGQIRIQHWPRDAFDLPLVRPDQLRVTGPAASAESIRALLAGEHGPVRDTVLANSAAALLVAGSVPNLAEGVTRAAATVDAGLAARLLDRWIVLSRSSEPPAQ